MINGMIVIFKEAGFTSHDVVAKMRGICGQKKIGHTGTLDPMATGVLPVCLGSATKLCDMLADRDKEYEAVLRLGVETDTQDITGQVLAQRPVKITEEEARNAALSFVGEYWQTPPMYSALKVNGRKLYELAREGREVERRARRVKIREIEILALELPLVRMRVVCSKGTYIRTLCHDIGEQLGCGGAMESLTRSRVGIFGIEEALTLEQLEKLRDEDKISTVIIKPDTVFEKDRAVTVTAAGQRMAENGNVLTIDQLERQAGETEFADAQQLRVYDRTGRFYGIYRYYKETDVIKPVRMFLER